MVFLVKRIGEGRARELILRGNILKAEEAHAAGLASVVAPHGNLRAAEEALSTELLTGNSLTSMGLSKEMLSKLPGMNLPEALEFAANMNAAARMTPDCRQGVEAFLSKKTMEW
jgi:methylglutaconyl-CoA hydratase